ncbi:hypothetical protein [Archaeoglobus neptunius]|uniref:hypothetical protein n=1 Tax=Archaeoglobus neptunius TaxID=2798580 RepID=UPI001925BEEF|nr:hypothetical protein [Archaeoglobus neptunius]
MRAEIFILLAAIGACIPYTPILFRTFYGNYAFTKVQEERGLQRDQAPPHTLRQSSYTS